MPIPIEDWGKDHWSTFLYAEGRCVDYKGVLNKEHMRCDPAVHPAQANSANALSRPGKISPTRLKDDTVESAHDDWSCLEDAEAAGLIANDGSGVNPRYVLTDRGWELAGRLRRYVAEGGAVKDFPWKA